MHTDISVNEEDERVVADDDDVSLRPMCPVARSILDAVRARQEWETRQRSRATCPPRVRYTDS